MKTSIGSPLLRTLSSLAAVAAMTCEAQFPAPDDFNPGADGQVQSLAVQTDGKILVGGTFTTLAGQPRNRIARVNSDGTLDSSFTAGADFPMFCLAVQADGKILVGGWFSKLGGQPRSHIGRLNSDGTLDTAFGPEAKGPVYSLALQPDGKILVGGSFTTLGGQPQKAIGRLNSDGTVDPNFNPGPGDFVGHVYSLLVQADGKILVGGAFTTLDGQPRNRIARFNSDGTLDATFHPGANNSVWCLAVQADGKILVGGHFTTLGGQPRSHIGRLNIDGTLDPTFDPGVESLPRGGGFVHSLVVQADGKILVGGHFTTLGGQPRNNIGRLNRDGTLNPTFGPGANRPDGVAPVDSLALQDDGKILVGGYFTSLGGQPRGHIGRLNNTGPATQTLSYASSTITWLRGGTSPEVWRTSFGASTNNGADWFHLGDGTRINGGWELTGVWLPANAKIRARGFTSGGFLNSSSWFVESTITVPTAVEALQDLIKLIHESSLSPQQPLLASLTAALASIQRGNMTAAINQLRAFQNKVRAQVAPLDAGLATLLDQSAQQINYSLTSG